MLVLDTGESWQLIEQPDHAELAGLLAESFGAGPFRAAHPALIVAAHRHDDGWAIWDRHPLADDHGEPVGFLGAPVPALLHSYEACADAVAHENPHAGLLVSMHVSGLRRRRYGRAPDSASRTASPTSPAEEDPRITRFVAREHERQTALRAGLSLPEAERWHQYAQLQLFDVLSLQLCLTDLERAGEPRELDAAPTAAGAAETVLRLTPLGGRRVSLQPWPFRRRPLHVSVRRRLLPAGRFASSDDLRRACSQAEPHRGEMELL